MAKIEQRRGVISIEDLKYLSPEDLVQLPSTILEAALSELNEKGTLNSFHRLESVLQASPDFLVVNKKYRRYLFKATMNIDDAIKYNNEFPNILTVSVTDVHLPHLTKPLEVIKWDIVNGMGRDKYGFGKKVDKKKFS